MMGICIGKNSPKKNSGKNSLAMKKVVLDRLIIDGPESGRKLETFWMQQLIKTDESDAGDFDFSGLRVWAKIVSVDENGIATAISPVDIGGTRQMKKIKIRFLDGRDAQTMVGFVMRIRMFKIDYSWVDVI